ncbi:polysulfide reductase NrfD [Sulfurospirillum sp. T05]|uniref:Polysulfide reductase NrfD n=1 Tax=Sulfurospirillum tamanense TaxID=2813362 RepID=A0ABS2WTE7_9BACT|nr:NrfD/PsrC family molybdoenzyme membrane anchor subunit [Sulfurospirillum tamanensis]MBN2964915.1 polysulfide reductase NrfD [Sulfurospirillum tamanensis]
MSPMWGSTVQYGGIVWPWPIAVYLFLAGLSAGAIISAIVIKWMKGNDSSPWDGIIKAGAILAPVTIGAGLLLLIVDLTRPLHFWKLLINYNFGSMMTIGVLALFAYFPVIIIFFLGIFRKPLIDEGPFGFLAPLADIAKNQAKLLEVITLVLAVGVGAYTGFLLSAMNSYPLLNTPTLPLLFLASGISAGISANLIVGLVFFKSTTGEENVSYLHGLDFKVILAEMFILVALFSGMYYQGGAAASVAAAALTTGGFATLFWVGVFGVGLAAPVGLNIVMPHSVKHSTAFIIFNAFLVLAGVMALRFYILYAGQTFVG